MMMIIIIITMIVIVIVNAIVFVVVIVVIIVAEPNSKMVPAEVAALPELAAPLEQCIHIYIYI